MANRQHLILSAIATVVVLLTCASPLHAEIVYFSNGRTLSIKSHRMEGESLVLVLRGGGEIVCESSVVSRIEADEVPYPEEAPLDQVRPLTDALALDESAPLTPTDGLLPNPQFDSLIETASARHGIDAVLVRAVIQVESNYQHRARSPKGAKGLMQLMPSTARQYGVSNPYDPASNIEGGVKHLKSLLERFPLKLALAAYNAGEAAVQRFGGVPPFAETRTYVERILKLVGRA